MNARTDVRELPTDLHRAVKEFRCIHAVTGKAPECKKCVNNYECGRCEFDQMLEDTDYAVHVEPQQAPRAILAA